VIVIGDALNLSYVPRWSVVPMLKRQTVSDHTYRVMVIYLHLCLVLDTTPNLVGALLHDVSECRTGDIPSPAKAHIKQQWPALETYGAPWKAPTVDDPVLVLADQIEAFTWLEMWANKNTAIYQWAHQNILSKIGSIIEEMDEFPALRQIVDGMLDQIIAGMTSA